MKLPPAESISSTQFPFLRFLKMKKWKTSRWRIGSLRRLRKHRQTHFQLSAGSEWRCERVNIEIESYFHSAQRCCCCRRRRRASSVDDC